MKYYIFLLFPFFFLGIASSDAQALEVRYKKVTVPVAEFNSRWRMSPEMKRQMVQRQEEKANFEYSYYTLLTDGKKSRFTHDTTYTTKESKDEGSRWGWGNNEIHPKIYKDFSQKESYTRTPKIDKNLCKLDTFKTRNDWQIGKKTKVFSKIQCRNAFMVTEESDTIRAWFAPKIPISDGPQTFSGLPGLIMALELKGIHFVAESINSIQAAEFTTPESTNCISDEEEYRDKYRTAISEYYINKKN